MTPVSWLLPAITYLTAQDHTVGQNICMLAMYSQSTNAMELHYIQYLQENCNFWSLFLNTGICSHSYLLFCCMEPVVQLACAAVNLRNHPCMALLPTPGLTPGTVYRYSDIFLNTCTCLYRLRYKFNWYPYKWLVMK